MNPKTHVASTLEAKITLSVCYEVGYKIIASASYEINGLVHFVVTRVECLDQMPFTMASLTLISSKGSMKILLSTPTYVYPSRNPLSTNPLDKEIHNWGR